MHIVLISCHLTGMTFSLPIEKHVHLQPHRGRLNTVNVYMPSINYACVCTRKVLYNVFIANVNNIFFCQSNNCAEVIVL